jgi:hypothetical protein
MIELGAHPWDILALLAFAAVILAMIWMVSRIE